MAFGPKNIFLMALAFVGSSSAASIHCVAALMSEVPSIVYQHKHYGGLLSLRPTIAEAMAFHTLPNDVEVSRIVYMPLDRSR